MTIHSTLVLDAASGGLFDAALADSLDMGIRQAVANHGASIAAVDKARLKATAAQFDSIVRQNADVADRVKRRMDARRADAKARGQRTDAFDATAGLFLARELEYRYAELLREPHPRPDAFELFPLDTSVPVGARTHTVSRIYDSGEVAVVRTGEDIPQVTVSRQEEQFPVRHYATSVSVDIFELASADFANWPLYAEKLRVARDKILEFGNRATWYGLENHGVYGIANYPWLAKAVSTVDFGSASADAQLTELQRLGNWSKLTSQSVFAPNACVMSTRMRQHFANTRLTSVNDTTILEFFLRTHATITSVEETPFLQGVGPGGTDGILFYRRDRLGISNVVVQPFTTLPIERNGFDQRTIAYMSHGGVVMRDVGNNLLAWVTPPST